MTARHHAGDGGVGAIGAGHIGLDPIQKIVVGASKHIAAGAAAGTDFIDIGDGVWNIVDDAHGKHVFGGVPVTVRQHYRQVVEQVIGALSLRVRLVVAQGVLVGDRPGLRVKAGNHQGVAQRRGHRVAGESASVEHLHATDGQAAEPVRGADGEGAGLSQRRRIGGTAIGQMRFVDTDVTTLCGGDQATDRHAVIRGRWYHGLDDRARVGSGIGQRRR